MTNSWGRLRRYAAVLSIMYMISSIDAVIWENCTSIADDLRKNGPIISPCKSEIILQTGQNYTLQCRGKTEVQIKQQEGPEEIIGPFRTESSNFSDRLDGEYWFESVLELYNVDQFSIGYYACFDDTVNGTDILNNLSEEPNNTEHITFIYIYVAGSGSLFAPMREVIVPRKQCKVVIECRPTTPDVEVSLMLIQDIAEPIYQQYSPKIGFAIDSEMLSDPSYGSMSMYRTIICEFSKGEARIEKTVVFQHVRAPPGPKIMQVSGEYLKGETFIINCTIDYEIDSVVNINWKYPPKVAKETIVEYSNEFESFEKTGGILYKNITVRNATKEHSGLYKCIASNNCGENVVSVKKKYLEKPRLEIKKPLGTNPMEVKSKKVKMSFEISAYPAATFEFLRDNKPLPKNASKYTVTQNVDLGDAELSISDLTVVDSANYTIVVTNGYLNRSYTRGLRVKEKPTVDFGPVADKKYMKNAQATLSCTVTGYPPPTISWIFSNGRDTPQTTSSSSIEVKSVYKQIAYMNISIHVSGNITCKAINDQGENSETRRLLVYEMDNGFGIRNAQDTWFSENQDVTPTCIASKYDFSSVTWLGSDEEDLSGTTAVEYDQNEFSLIAKLKFPSISLNQSGPYSCRGKRFNGSYENQTISISVAPLHAPVIYNPNEDQTLEVLLFQPVQFTCQAEGVPPPKLEWHKDKVLMDNETNAKIFTNNINRTTINSTIVIKQMKDENKGVYECLASNNALTDTRVYTIALKAETKIGTWWSVILVIILFLILVVLYLIWKVRKEKRFRKELAAAGLLYFTDGVPKSLNPDLGIDEQAELLPYDEKFEFPVDKLILGKQLGAGAFGVVYKADARGIINAEETTEVAVKMVKKTADNMYIKALASELKIMVHLGKHINIVNLLGACTKHVGKRELIVIVEYCKFGNIHNYMQRHREVFIDQLTDNKEKNLGRVNRGYSCSSGSTGAHSDYFASSTQDTDHTFVNTANTNRSTRKENANHNQQVEFAKVSEGYVQPEWRTNYESDYSFDGRNPRPLTSRDLLVWAFQIARGMEYLASRKVLHGDLAARNVLLAEDNIVKICDFGLARSIYKNDEYQKKENCLLPVKWLAIECMTDRIFSTQSDVWSFGIVLWELFSLAKTPYPNISPAAILQWLSEGKRLAKPNYADDRLYDVMMKCWELKPTSRPTFSQLQEILGGFLEDNVRNHYVDLNTAYMDTNVQPGGEDYLAMVCAPDYNNLVTPSPHHYVNDRSFFPTTPSQIDDEGYLQMSPATRQNIFSPRTQDTKFDFDARKFNPRVSEASSCGSELTPMLTLNNLPARSGSESDHEGNQSPYLNMCPRIDEETDDVFATYQINAKNALNTVTNPTYITLDTDKKAGSVDIEKKPKDIINTYINIPNGLVK